MSSLLPRETIPLDALVGDAEAHLRKSEGRLVTHGTECHKWHTNCMIERLLDKLVTVHAIAGTLEESARWREIATEPPKKNRFAIFWSKYEERCFCPQTIGRFDGGCYVQCGAGFSVPLVRFSHWMPLPKQPDFKHGRKAQGSR